jgi:uncharacterized repeat protein (TIGR03843 family)
MLYGSNYTFLVGLDAGPGKYLRAIYKPRDGERPLYDFPSGSLYKREYAAFLVSRALGWPDVPLTLLREGPHGPGVFQLFVEHDPQVTYFDLIGQHEDELRRFAVFDILVNNADRKGGHCLLGPDGRIWSIDHGLTFHPVFKVRSVMMEFWGAEVPEELVNGLETLRPCLQTAAPLHKELSELLTPREVGMLSTRLEALVKDRAIPMLDPSRNIPWPLV